MRALKWAQSFVVASYMDCSNEQGLSLDFWIERMHTNEHDLGFVVILGFKRERPNEHDSGFVVVLGFKRERSNEHDLGFVVFPTPQIHIFIILYM